MNPSPQGNRPLPPTKNCQINYTRTLQAAKADELRCAFVCILCINEGRERDRSEGERDRPSLVGENPCLGKVTHTARHCKNSQSTKSPPGQFLAKCVHAHTHAHTVSDASPNFPDRQKPIWPPSPSLLVTLVFHFFARLYFSFFRKEVTNLESALHRLKG